MTLGLTLQTSLSMALQGILINLEVNESIKTRDKKEKDPNKVSRKSWDILQKKKN